MIEKLRQLYALAAGWAFFTEVRSGTGQVEDLRRADAMAVSLWPSRDHDGIEVHGFELKAKRGDFLREKAQPDKAKLSAFCTRWYLVVPAPWKQIVFNERELPRGWGLIELGTGEPVTVVEAEKKRAQGLTDDMLRGLLRAACAQGGSEAVAAGAPMVLINRPSLSRTHVGLGCGHVAVMPLEKKMPRSVPCFSCAKGLPPDVEIAEAVIEDAEDEDLLRLVRLANAKVEERGLVEPSAAE